MPDSRPNTCQSLVEFRAVSVTPDQGIRKRKNTRQNIVAFHAHACVAMINTMPAITLLIAVPVGHKRSVLGSNLLQVTKLQ